MKTVIFDLDGTLCDITHRLHFIKDGNKDWMSFNRSCVSDVPKPDIIALFHALKMAGHKIIIVSGRSDNVRIETEDWLSDNSIYPDKLIMRKEGDYTPDDELKKGWLCDGFIACKEDILFTVDDRQRVVDMWRDQGLTCLQVDMWKETK